MAGQTEAEGVDRRQFLKVLGTVGGGAAVLSGCSTDRVAKLVPYMVQSEDQVPGIPTWYASTCAECSSGCGLHVKTREGRPIKLEGNPDHPINAGTLCSRGQAGLQALYNPDRLTGPMAKNAAGTWDEIKWDDAIARFAAKVGAAHGELAVINGYGASTFSSLLTRWTSALGGFITNFEPFSREAERLANRKTWGRTDLPVYDFAAAKYIVSFGADYLETWGSVVEQQRGLRGVARFPRRRNVARGVRRAADVAHRGEFGRMAERARRFRGAGGAGDGAGHSRQARPRARGFAEPVFARQGRQGNRADRRPDHHARHRVRGGVAIACGGRRRRRAASRRDRPVPGRQHAERSRRQHRQDGEVRQRRPRRAKATAASSRCSTGWRRASSRSCWCTTPTRCTRCRRAASSPRRSPRCPSRCRPRRSSTRPRRPAT